VVGVAQHRYVCLGSGISNVVDRTFCSPRLLTWMIQSSRFICPYLCLNGLYPNESLNPKGITRCTHWVCIIQWGKHIYIYIWVSVSSSMYRALLSLPGMNLMSCWNAFALMILFQVSCLPQHPLSENPIYRPVQKNRQKYCCVNFNVYILFCG
jgi:hypothetical protein